MPDPCTPRLPPPSLSMDRCFKILTRPHLPLFVIEGAWEDAKLRRGQQVNWATIGPPAHRRAPAAAAVTSTAAEAEAAQAPAGNAVLAALRAAGPAIAAAVASRRIGRAPAGHGDHGGDAA